MKIPIPDDWDRQEWLCAEIQWPASPQYVAILFGLLTELTRGRFWEESTGSVRAAQEIGWWIHDKNFPLSYCNDVTPPIPDSEMLFTFVDGDGEGECAVSGCSIPYGKLRVDERGMLQYQYCGIWYDVENWSAAAVGGQPAAPDTEDITPETPVSGIACQKAAWIAQEFVRFLRSAWDNLSANSTIFAWSNDVRSDMAGYSLSNWSMLKLFQATNLAWVAGGFDGNFPVTGEQTLRCQFEAFLNSADYGLSRSEYEALQTVVQTFPSTALRLWILTAWDALNYSNIQKMASDARSLEVYDCSCPGVIIPYTGVVTWEDSREMMLNGEKLISSTRLAPNLMRHVIRGDVTENYQEVHWREQLQSTGLIRELEIRWTLEVAPRVPGYFPAFNYSDTMNNTADYLKPLIGGYVNEVRTYFPRPGMQTMICLYNEDVNPDTHNVEYGIKVNPKDQNPDYQEFVMLAEIVYAGPARA